MVAWLDPEAVGAAWIDGRPDGPLADLEADALATLFAIPPRAARLLRDTQLTTDGLVLLLGAEGAARMVRPGALAMLPAVARGTYVLRHLAAPKAEVEAALADHGMEASEVEGYTLWEPTGRFPWRLLFLDDETLAMIPVQEIGSGIGPLTAARDLPPSPLATQLGEALADPTLVLELFTQGPLLHMDLSVDVGVVRLSLRRWRVRGLDAQLLLQPLGDPAAAAAELSAREGTLESDALRELLQRIVFTAEPPVVLGRLQLPAEDLAPLRRHR